MANNAPWPVRVGVFKSSGQSDYEPIVQTPSCNSVTVEFPISPPPTNVRFNIMNKFKLLLFNLTYTTRSTHIL